MKTTLIVLAFIAGLLLIGLIGRGDAAYETCKYQSNYTVPTFEQCIANQYEQNSDR